MQAHIWSLPAGKIGPRTDHRTLEVALWDAAGRSQRELVHSCCCPQLIQANKGKIFWTEEGLKKAGFRGGFEEAWLKVSASAMEIPASDNPLIHRSTADPHCWLQGQAAQAETTPKTSLWSPLQD